MMMKILVLLLFNCWQSWAVKKVVLPVSPFMEAPVPEFYNAGSSTGAEGTLIGQAILRGVGNECGRFPNSSSPFVLPMDQSVSILDASDAFDSLTRQEKLYSHFLSKASWYGGLIVLLQTSPEAADIFRLIHNVNSRENLDNLESASGVTKDEFLAYLIYCSAVYNNMGNYKGYGDTKFIPNLSMKAFGKIIKGSEAWKQSKGEMEMLWNQVRYSIYSLSNREKQLGLGQKGITKYFSPNCDKEDSELVNKFLKHKKIEGTISRVIKLSENEYEIRQAAVDKNILFEERFDGKLFRVTAGGFSELLDKVCDSLNKAIPYSKNEREKEMLIKYIESFKTGNLTKHKEGSAEWVQNKSPIVETYIGFIESYRDPTGIRGEFEGFVAMVNKRQSEKFQTLVSHSKQLLPLLPWPREFERSVFKKPDFTSLEVLTFGGSGIPGGINIPNYSEIRRDAGFKNVILGNVVSSAYTGKNFSFVSSEDNELLIQYKLKSYEVKVGLHELLGHGSGKLFYKNGEEANFPEDLINPVTGDTVKSWYEEGETYDSKFTDIARSLEECRAECVGIYLSMYDNILEIFGYNGTEAENARYINWLSMLQAGIKGLANFSPTAGEWKQAHARARFVILQAALEAGQGFANVEEIVGVDGKPDLLLTMDKTKLETVGMPAIGKLLKKIQVFKSTGDDVGARLMYNKYSEVNDQGPYPWAVWRDIVMARKKARSFKVQANTKIGEDGSVELVQYEKSPRGMVESWVDRFHNYQEIDSALKKLSLEDQEYWPITASPLECLERK